MNELQIKLTADIKDIQSALTKVKKTLKEFEDSASSSTDKANGKLDRQKGIIEELNNELKKLKVSIIQATSKEQIAGFNAELEKTNQKLSELNALGKTVTAPAVRSFDNLKRAQGAASSAAISFGRIIQDAPFGIIGVANNIQNFGEQFVALGGKSATAGQKLSQFFSALITPSNLAILAVSALTAAYQAYTLGLFDAKEETQDLNKELEDFKKSLDGVSKAQLEGTQNAKKQIQEFELLRLQAENLALSDEKRLLAVKKLKEEFPDLLKGYTDEEILLGKVGKAYEELTKQITAKALASAFSSQTAENAVKSATLEFQEQKRGLEILKETAELNKLIGDRRRAEQGGQFGAGQNVAISNEILEKQKEINDLEEKNKESKKTRNELTEENVFLNKKVSEEIAKAGGLIDDNNDKVKEGGEKLNRVFDDQILFVQRFGKEAEKNKQKTESLVQSLAKSLEQEQKALFETIASLKQEPADLINTEKLNVAQQRLSEIDALIGSIASKRVETPEIVIDVSKLEGLELPSKQDPGIIEKLEKEIALYEKLVRVTSDPAQLEKYKLKLSELRQELDLVNGEKVKSNLEIVEDAFTSLASGIVASLDISNRSLRGFLTTLISATPKIIAAISAQANANAGSAAKNIAADKAESISSGIKQGTKFAEALGPVGLALLPVFIAGAVAVISSAFSKTGGGGSATAGTGSTFTNRREFGGPVSKGRAYIVGERRPELFVPNTNGVIIPQLPSMDYSGTSMSAGAMAIDVNIQGVSYGDDILFTVQQAQIRRNIR
jgi:chromosome segregation ATPase